MSETTNYIILALSITVVLIGIASANWLWVFIWGLVALLTGRKLVKGE